MLYKAHKIELYTTKRQEQYLYHCAYSSKYVYNQLVEYFNKAEKIPTRKLFQDRILELRSEHTWMQDISASLVRSNRDFIQGAITKAFSKEVVAKRAKSNNPSLGFPKFKGKYAPLSFSLLDGVKFKVENRHFRFEKMPKNLGRLKLRQPLRFKGKVKEMTISLSGGKWFVAFIVDTADIIEREPSKDSIIGVDLGIKTLATLSNGKQFTNIKALQRKSKKLRQLNKQLHRRKIGSNNRAKTRRKLNRLYHYTTLQRKAILHELTSHLIDSATTIVIEDLNVSGMLKNKRLSRLLSDVGLFEFRRQLEYKCGWYDRELIVVDRYFPSSKTCSNCGNVKDVLSLSERTYRCRECNLTMDRDLNASINLKQVATRSSDTINDYGEVA